MYTISSSTQCPPRAPLRTKFMWLDWCNNHFKAAPVISKWLRCFTMDFALSWMSLHIITRAAVAILCKYFERQTTSFNFII